LAHEVSDRHRLSAGFDDPAVNEDVCRPRLLTDNLELLAGVFAESISVGRCHEAAEGLGGFFLLRPGDAAPGRPDSKPRHERQVESPPDDWLKRPVAPLWPESRALPHNRQQCVIK